MVVVWIKTTCKNGISVARVHVHFSVDTEDVRFEYILSFYQNGIAFSMIWGQSSFTKPEYGSNIFARGSN